jgi:hypothetical protein
MNYFYSDGFMKEPPPQRLSAVISRVKWFRYHHGTAHVRITDGCTASRREGQLRIP